MPRRISEPKREEVTRVSGICIMKTFIICTYTSILPPKHRAIKDEMGYARARHGRMTHAHLILVM
jgi:hypothetical protein